MTKSYECVILGLYSGIFKDIAVSLPTVRGLGRDESRLLSTVQTRGLSFLTIDMPAFGKHFDRCLADGRLTPSNIPAFGCIRSSPIPRFLSGMLMRVFESNGVLMSLPCITSIFLLRQLFSAAKKIKMDCKENVRERTLLRYIEQERSLRSPSLDWHGERLDHGGDHQRYSLADGLLLDEGRPNLSESVISRQFCDIVHEVADRYAGWFGYFNPADWRFKHGPGAVADSVGGKFKYNFPTWNERLESVFPYADFGFSNYSQWVDALRTGVSATSVAVPSKVITVPKSQKAPRIIAKEPTANMWCQQAIRDFLESGVSRSSLLSAISFRDQSKNAVGALEASHSGDRWTVDLSDASDRLSLWLVERIFRGNRSLLDALHATRSETCSVPLKGGDVLLQMKKFAPQGSATTFPVQSIVFAILAISAVLYSKGMRTGVNNIDWAAEQVQVFGDDTLIPEYAGRAYVELLTYCGLSVNYSKTYGTGKFRESCGVEAYDGVDVTPAYITVPYTESDPSSVASTVECVNNFYKKGLWHSAAALESTLPFWVRNHLITVGPDVGAFGLFSFCGSQVTTVTRWNSRLQREEYLSLTVNSEVRRVQPGGGGHLLQYFTEDPNQDIHWMSGTDGRPSSKLRKRWESIGILDL